MDHPLKVIGFIFCDGITEIQLVYPNFGCRRCFDQSSDNAEIDGTALAVPLAGVSVRVPKHYRRHYLAPRHVPHHIGAFGGAAGRTCRLHRVHPRLHELYIRHGPRSLGTLAMQYLHLFDPPCSCSFIQWATKGAFHRSGLYLPSLQDHARPCVHGPFSERQLEIDAAKFGFPRVLSYGLSPQERMRQVLQVTVHPLNKRRDPSVKLEWSLAASTHVSDRILQQRLDHLKWLEHRANEIKELLTCSSGMLCVVVFGLQHFLCIYLVRLAGCDSASSHGQRLPRHWRQRVAAHLPPAAFRHAIYDPRPGHGREHRLW